jgi:hypothetical protein
MLAMMMRMTCEAKHDRSMIVEDEDEILDDSVKCERELAGTRTGSRMGPDSTYT